MQGNPALSYDHLRHKVAPGATRAVQSAIDLIRGAATSLVLDDDEAGQVVYDEVLLRSAKQRPLLLGRGDILAPGGRLARRS